MTKCNRCGAEYDGEICPVCGKAAESYAEPVAEEAPFTPPPRRREQNINF